MELDHLAITAASLEEGVARTEERLGVSLAPNIGRHALFGTWNRLLSLGPGLYLEVIAPDPAVPDPGRPRWFDLDHAGAPRLGNWICRLPRPDLIPAEAGPRLALSRDDLTWEIAVPEDGSMPQEGGFPTCIAWKTGVHPADRLADAGVRLAMLTVLHPEAEALAARIGPWLSDRRVRFEVADHPALQAEFDTARGRVAL